MLNSYILLDYGATGSRIILAKLTFFQLFTIPPILWNP